MGETGKLSTERKEEEIKKGQRVRIKGTICALILIFLLSSAVINAVKGTHADERLPKGKWTGTTEGINSVPQEFGIMKNVLMLEAGEEELVCFYDNGKQNLKVAKQAFDDGQEKSEELAGQICDLLLTDGIVTKVSVKRQKIHAAVRSVDGQYVSLDGFGKLPLDPCYRGYAVYGELQEKSARDLVIGYDFADFIVEDGVVHAILFGREESMDEICVLLKNSDYEGLYHEALEVWGEEELKVSFETDNGSESVILKAGEHFRMEAADETFWEKTESVKIRPATATGKIVAGSIGRSQGVPQYAGELEVCRVEQGMIVINRIGVEEYLCGVVPSEMPSSFPEEALKAQAICARTYAYGKMLHAGYPAYGAHLDDSTSFQVYQNVTGNEKTNDAVSATRGLVLFARNGDLAETYYYSTSCGQGTNESAWTAGNDADEETFLQAKKINRASMQKLLADGTGDKSDSDPAFLMAEFPDDYEFDEPWYRWTYAVEELQPEILLRKIREYLGTGEEIQFRKVLRMEVTKRGAGAVATELLIVTDGGEFCVRGEYPIRQVLCDDVTAAERKDGGKYICGRLLPSAFICLTTEQKDGFISKYVVYGGGYGHGIGMSQNAARKMALEGRSAEEILNFFYADCRLNAMDNGGEHAEEGVEGNS